MYQGGRKAGSKNRVVRDACRRGHPRTPENTHVHAVTGRICCRVCERIWANRNHKRPEYRERDAAWMAHYRLERRDEYLEKRRRWKVERSEFLNAYKAALGCQTCGEKEARRLHFHHRNRTTKDIDVGAAMLLWTEEKMLAEIEKCDVLCASCHGKLHAEMRKLHAAERVGEEGATCRLVKTAS